MAEPARQSVIEPKTSITTWGAPLTSTFKLSIYGQRPRSDMFRVMLAELGIESKLVDTLSLDHNGPCLIDAEVLTAEEKSALMSVEELGPFRDPIFILDNSSYIWPENLETLNTLDRVAAIPDIVTTYVERNWAHLEANLRNQTRRSLKLTTVPRKLTTRFKILILTETTSAIPQNIKPTLEQPLIKPIFAFSQSEAVHKISKLYSQGEVVDGMLDLVGLDKWFMPALHRHTIRALKNPIRLHGLLMQHQRQAPPRPADIDFPENKLSATYTHAFPKTFWKQHAKLQMSTYARLKIPFSAFSLGLDLSEEGLLTSQLRSFDSVGRISKARLAVFLVGLSEGDGKAYLRALGFDTNLHSIQLNEAGIDRL